MKQMLYILVLALLLAACGSEDRKDIDVSGIQIEDVQIKRYGEALFNISTDSIGEQLAALAPEYRIFLGYNFDDSLKIIQIRDYINDPKLRDLYRETEQKFPELNELEKELTTAFKHIRYYYPSFEVPQVYTYISGLQYEQPVMYADSALIIGLDLYLGEDFKPYKEIGLPRYQTRQMKPEYIAADAMKAISLDKIPYKESRNLLDEMIKNGKTIYFAERMLPDAHDSLLSGFSASELEWLQNSQSELWAFMLDNELLFSPDYNNIRKFTAEGPFTPGFGQESPSGIGNWFGWQIVRRFMERNPGISLPQMMNITDAQRILQESGYKPEK